MGLRPLSGPSSDPVFYMCVGYVQVVSATAIAMPATRNSTMVSRFFRIGCMRYRLSVLGNFHSGEGGLGFGSGILALGGVLLGQAAPARLDY